MVSYSTEAGCFYAVNSLLQMIESLSGQKFIKKGTVEDAPKFAWRGLHLDVSRHFFSVDEVKRYIDLMAYYKFNIFHWHLTDDQGWRIEIKKYPELTKIGGRRDSTIIGHYSHQPRTFDGEEYKGFYTQEEIKEIVAYADQRYITVVPEIELPGHSRAALAAYPEYSCTGVQQPVPGVWGVFDDIYCSKKESIDFLKDILAEVMQLFPSEYIHIGGDEAPKTRWKVCENCQNVIRENNLKDEHELQSFFIRQMDDYLTENGRKLIGWDEILEGGLSPNAAVTSWGGEKGGIEAAKQGHYVVMSPTTYCYFDYYQSSHAIEPLAIGGYLPLEKVYAFNPVPESLSAEEARYIMGGQANLWTEYIPDMKQLEYMTYPRALALAQSLWCIEKPEYDVFLESYLSYHEDFLSRHQVNFARSIHYPELMIERATNGINISFKGAIKDASFDVNSVMSDFPQMANRVVMGKDDFLFLERSSEGKEKEMTCKVSGRNFKEVIKYTFNVSSDLGIPIEFVTQPHPKYNHNGSLNLVDGIKGTLPWKGSEWLGFQESEIEFIIDLEKKDDVSLLEIGFLKDNGSWIYLPEEVTLFVSDDNKNWTKASQTKVDQTKMNGHAFQFIVNKETRYVKVEINAMEVIPDGKEGGGHTPWTFIDEIEILYRHEWK